MPLFEPVDYDPFKETSPLPMTQQTGKKEAEFIPIDYDPFATAPAAQGEKLTPVDYNPFELKDVKRDTSLPKDIQDYQTAVQQGADIKTPDRYIRGQAPNAPPPHMGTDFKSVPKQPDIIGTTTRPFKAQAYEAAKALNLGIAGFSQRLEDIAQYISDKTGLDKGGIFGEASKTYAENADYWDKKAKEVGVNVIDEIVGSALGGALPGVGEFILNVPYSAASGAAEAHKKGESELMGAVVEGGKRALLGQVFKGAGMLKQPYGTAATGTAFAAQTAAEGGSPEEIAKSAGTGLLYGAMGKGRVGLKDIKESLQAKKVIDKGAKSIPSTQPEPLVLEQEKTTEPKGEVKPVPTEETRPTKASLTLSPSQKQTLEIIRKEIDMGEAGAVIPVRDEAGYRTGQSVAVPSSFPEYFQNQGYKKKETLSVIDKALRGEPLAERQKGLIQNLNDAYREKVAQDIKAGRDTKEVSAWDLNEGDSFKKQGEEFKVVEKDTSGFLPEVTLKDGEEIKLAGDETVKVDRGTLEKSNIQRIGVVEPGKQPVSEGTTPEEHPSSTALNISPSERDVKGEGEMGFTPDKEFRRETTTETEVGALQKRSDIVKFLSEKLQLPIRTGRFRGGNKGVMGIFKVKPEVVRTKFANDIETISHEIGHALEKYLWPETRDVKGNLTGTAFKDFAHELNAIASQPRKGQPTEPEGFAEFMRLYVTDEAKAIEKAPNFYNHFERTLQANAPEIREIFLQAREDFNRWIQQPSMAKVLAQISIGEKQRPQRDLDSLLKEAYTATVDDLFPLRKAVQDMTGKEEIPAIKDPYKLARLLRGWWGKAESFLEYKPFDYTSFEWKGKSFKKILEPVKDNLNEFRAYIVAKRALELNQRGIESGIAARDARKVVAQFDNNYNKTLTELVEYQDTLLRYLRDSGVIAPRDFARMKQANRDYVPFYRVFESEQGKGAGKGLEAKQPIKAIKGSWRDIVDPLESIVKNTYLFINMAERNGVGRALVDLANSREGMGKFVDKIPIPMRKQKVGVDEVLDKWSEKIDDPHIKEMLKEMNLSEETVSIFRPSAFVPKENVISVWRQGKRELYEVSPDIARAFQALDKETTNTIIRLMSYPARWLRAGATLAPEFIARNPIRDQFSAFVYSKYNFIPVYDMAKGIFHVAKGDELYWQWRKSGGEHSMLVSLDREYLQKNLEKIMQGKMEGMKDLVKNPVEALRVLSELGEAATRVGEFGKGIKQEGTTKEGMLEAAFSSREVTLDFAKIGAKTKAVNAIIAFWNAQVQGTDRMVRAFKDRPLETSLKVIAGITLPSVLLAAANHDDERWKEIPQWQKDLFWIVMTKEHIYRIPKPFEIGIVFGTMPERMVEHILNKNPRAFDGLLKSIASGAAPGIIPTAAAPFLENWANKSFFTDRPIVPRSKEGLPSQYQYQPYTTEAAKKIGDVLSRIAGDDSSMSSPAKIENTIRGLSGGLGTHALRLADYSLRKAGLLPDKIKPSPTLSDIPFIKAFAVRYPAADAESIQRFYDGYGIIKKKLAASRQLIKEFEGEKARELLGGGIIRLDKIEKALQRSQQLIDFAYANPTMTSEDKRQLIDKTYLLMIEIAKKGNLVLEKAEAVNAE